MTTILASTVLVLISQLAAPQPYKPRVKVNLGGTRQFVLVNPKTTPEQAVIVEQVPRQVLCTMPMLRPQRDVDPKIVVEPPKKGAKIRAIEVPACIETASR